MALKEHRLEKINQFGGATKEDGQLSNWLYVTTDTIAQVIAASYFDAMAAKGLQAGDMIMCMTSTGPIQLKVTSISAADVVVVNKFGHAHGQATTVAASDTIATSLAHVSLVVASLNDAPVAGCQFVTADTGDQAGAPAAGSFYLKTWKDTATADTAKIAATTFGKKVNWIAFGY